MPSVCFTGRGHGRDGSFIERNRWFDYAHGIGFFVHEKLSRHTDFLVMADPDSTSKKALQARSWGVDTISYMQFLDELRNRQGLRASIDPSSARPAFADPSDRRPRCVPHRFILDECQSCKEQARLEQARIDALPKPHPLGGVRRIINLGD